MKKKKNNCEIIIERGPEYVDNEWKVNDRSEEFKIFGLMTIDAYSDEFKEEVELANTVANDANLEEILGSFNLMSKARDMDILLRECCYKFYDIGDYEMAYKIEKLISKNNMPNELNEEEVY